MCRYVQLLFIRSLHGNLEAPGKTVGMSLRKGCSSPSIPIGKGNWNPLNSSILRSPVLGFFFGFEKFEKNCSTTISFKNKQSSIFFSDFNLQYHYVFKNKESSVLVSSL